MIKDRSLTHNSHDMEAAITSIHREWTRKMWHMSKAECYSPTKKKENMSLAASRTDPQIVILRKIR